MRTNDMIMIRTKRSETPGNILFRKHDDTRRITSTDRSHPFGNQLPERLTTKMRGPIGQGNDGTQ